MQITTSNILFFWELNFGIPVTFQELNADHDEHEEGVDVRDAGGHRLLRSQHSKILGNSGEPEFVGFFMGRP